MYCPINNTVPIVCGTAFRWRELCTRMRSSYVYYSHITLYSQCSRKAAKPTNVYMYMQQIPKSLLLPDSGNKASNLLYRHVDPPQIRRNKGFVYNGKQCVGKTEIKTTAIKKWVDTLRHGAAAAAADRWADETTQLRLYVNTWACVVRVWLVALYLQESVVRTHRAPVSHKQWMSNKSSEMRNKCAPFKV